MDLHFDDGEGKWSLIDQNVDQCVAVQWLCSGCAVTVSCFACGCIDVAVLLCWSFADMLEL